MTNATQPPDWQVLDELIFANQKLELLKLLCDKYGYPLAHAITVYSERYAQLRIDQPHRFLITHADYWQGFYS